jgi:hypothetical protein
VTRAAFTAVERSIPAPQLRDPVPTLQGNFLLDILAPILVCLERPELPVAAAAAEGGGLSAEAAARRRRLLLNGLQSCSDEDDPSDINDYKVTVATLMGTLLGKTVGEAVTFVTCATGDLVPAAVRERAR